MKIALLILITTFLQKGIGVVGLFLLVLLWNRYAPQTIIKGLVGFHKKYNHKNLKKQPIKFVVENEEQIIKYIKVFYWISAIALMFVLLSID